VVILFLFRLGLVGQLVEGGGVQHQEVAVARVEGGEAAAVEGGGLRRAGAAQPGQEEALPGSFQ